jgi:hypothetical protein
MNYQPSYTLQPSPEPITRSTPSPPPSDTAYPYLPPLPIPPISSFNNHNHSPNNNHFQRQIYPTSTPYQPHHQQQHTSPDPTPSLSKLRLPPPPTPTSYFPNGYASPTTSSYSSSEPGSRDEIDLMEPGSLGGSHFHTGGQAMTSTSGVDGMIFRGDGIHLDKHSPRNDTRERDHNHHPRKRWNMRDFTLVQTVGMDPQ